MYSSIHCYNQTNTQIVRLRFKLLTAAVKYTYNTSFLPKRVIG